MSSKFISFYFLLVALRYWCFVRYLLLFAYGVIYCFS